MFGSIGGTEILVIAVIVLLVFGPKRLPEFGRTIGKGLAEFKRASNDLKRSLEEEITIEEARSNTIVKPDKPESD
jgi:TatA/E family protein of Tat protein translocase